MAVLSRLPITRNKQYTLNGLKSYVYALHKYNITPTQPSLYTRPQGGKFLIKQNEDGSSGQIGADDLQNDAFYTVPIQIGTPAQTVDVDFDSGSADLWVWSTQLDAATQAAGQQNNVKIFNEKKSTTYKPASGSWQIQYGDGSGAHGSTGTDIVTIGNITIKDQTIELAQQVSESFQSQKSSGLLGLAFGNINTVKPTPAKTPVDNMIAQGAVSGDNQLWSVYLGSVKDVQDPDQGKSWYTFGNYDESVVKASGQQINWAPVDKSEGFWMFASESAEINGKTLPLSGNRAMADTGTTLMLCSDEFCKALYGSIKGAQYDAKQGGWLIPKTGIADRPEVKVAVGQGMITIEKEQLGWAELDNNSGMVFGAIQSRGQNPFDIFGDTFLICCYAIFDVGKERFGCVQRPDPTPAGPTGQ